MSEIRSFWRARWVQSMAFSLSTGNVLNGNLRGWVHSFAQAALGSGPIRPAWGGGSGGWLNAACCISMHFARYWSQLELTLFPIVLLLDTWDLILCLILFWSTCHFLPIQYIFGAAPPGLPSPTCLSLLQFFLKRASVWEWGTCKGFS